VGVAVIKALLPSSGGIEILKLKTSELIVE
jgi:hypothetical protein